MKNLYLAIMLAGLCVFASCSSSKKLADPTVGAWEYVVSGTPNGDVSGTMFIAKEGEMYSGSLEGDAGTLELQDVEITDNQMKSKFSYQGYTMNLEGTFEGDTFEGKVIYDYYNSFPVKATKATQK